MDSTLFSTGAALAGTVIGGLTSFLTAWVSQSVQARNQRRAAESARRQELYGAFMDELAQLYARARCAPRPWTTATSSKFSRCAAASR